MNNDQFTSFLAVITKHHEEDQKALLDEIKALRAQNAEGAASQATSSSTFKNLSDSMNEFTYDPEMNLTFDAWYRRYESVFTTEAVDLSNPTKVRLLTGKLKNSDFEQFANTILPIKTHELTLNDAVDKLKSIFGHRQSTFSQRKKCFTLTKLESEDFACYAARVNKHCERFDVEHCSVDEFKAQIFVNGLKCSQDSLILEKLLAKLDSESTSYALLKTEQQKTAFVRLKLQDLVNEADRIISLKQDKSSVAETSSNPEVFAIKRSFNKTDSAKPTFPNHGAEQPQPPSPCLHCGGMHWHRDCPFKDKTCFDCHETGHKAGYCAMTQSRPPFKRQKSNSDHTPLVQKVSKVDFDDCQRKYIVPNVNGLSVKLQLDTGSDITIISRSNWIRLGKPTLSNTNKKAGSASGNVIPLLGSFPCEVKLNGKEEFGECYVSTLQLDLFGIDWITIFDLWTVPIATLCNKVQANTADDLLTEIKVNSPLLSSEGLGCCTKTKASLTLKAGAKPGYRNARPGPHAATSTVASELERLQRLKIISPTEFSASAADPFMHFSATFNAAERNYPQMHKEARALVFGQKKSHFYIAGRYFTIHIDHKPLLAIFNPKSGIPMYTAARLQRYAITVLPYDFDIHYINTDSFGYADVISRLMSSHTKPDEDIVIASVQLHEEENDVHCFAIESASQFPVTFQAIQTATTNSPSLQKVARFIENDSWPQKRSKIMDLDTANYFQHRQQLSLKRDCIFFGERILIPNIHRQQTFSDLHQGHPGECRMKLLAAGKVFWPNINSDIEKLVKTCETCSTISKTPIKHIKTAPYSPQSNGQAERFVDLLKTGLKKATGNINQKLQEFLFCYRRTPSYNLGLKSPSELLNSRLMKTRLDRLKLQTPFQHLRNEQMAKQFDRHHGAKFREFQINDTVYYKLHSTTEKWEWAPAVIMKRLGTVNYEIRIDLLSNQRIIKAHSNQLKFHHTKNEWSKLFEIPEWPETIEPIIVPQQIVQRQEENPEHIDTSQESDDDFQSAESREEPAQEVRRSGRPTKGQASRWHQDYQRF